MRLDYFACFHSDTLDFCMRHRFELSNLLPVDYYYDGLQIPQQ